MAVELDPQLLEILACPCDEHAPLRIEADVLVCTSCGRRFPVIDGIPVLLLDEALPAGSTGAGSRRGGESTGSGPAGDDG